MKRNQEGGGPEREKRASVWEAIEVVVGVGRWVGM